jgi:two-component system sensor histidine kinase PhoQ
MVARKKSLSARLLVTMAILLLAAFALTIFLLDTIFRQTSENAIEDVLEVQVLALISVAEPDVSGDLVLPEKLPESRLSTLGSGLYAEIVDARGRRVWRSPSAAGLALTQGLSVQPGERLYVRRTFADGLEALVFGIGVSWEFAPNVSRVFQVYVGQDLAAYDRQLDQFRRQLMSWFAGVMLALLLGIWLLLRWGLAPVRRMADEIAAIEGGDMEVLSENYPRELVGVARGMNALVKSERQRISRFRTTMDDLAHSLKTPLAVFRSELEKRDPDDSTLRDQVGRMQGVIDYQLRRAAATGPRTLAARPVLIVPICKEIAGSLRKIHREKEVHCDIRVPAGTSFPAEQGDLYEVIGNLMDNAWKWCNGRIVIDGSVEQGAKKSDLPALILTFSDDGPGISDTEAEKVLDRGARAEPRGDVPGQGIGLAVVAEIIDLYRGEVSIRRSTMGGAEFSIRLPFAANSFPS